MNEHSSDMLLRGNWMRVYDHRGIRYYYRGVRMPWILWVMFS
jgi:hypothetical protein